ncbi:MAG: hypothetical protein AB9835_08380 [Eubacteriales bacterium]
MHDINFFSQLQSAGKVNSKSVLTVLSVLIVVLLNIMAVMFLNIQLNLKQTQLAQLNEYINSPQSIQLLADAASANEELRIKQAYYNAASTLAIDIKAAGMLTSERLDIIMSAIPEQVIPSAFTYASGDFSFDCKSPPDADFLLRTIKSLEDTGLFVSVISEGIQFIDPTEQESVQPIQEDGGEIEQPIEPHCTFSIKCTFVEGGQ